MYAHTIIFFLEKLLFKTLPNFPKILLTRDGGNKIAIIQYKAFNKMLSGLLGANNEDFPK